MPQNRSSTRSSILKTAKRIFGMAGYQGTTLDEVAKFAGMSASTMRNHFDNKESLLLETQRTIFRELHARITKQSSGSNTPTKSALDALDSMWSTIQDMKTSAPFIVETLMLRGGDGGVHEQIRTFYKESTTLLEDGIRTVFADKLSELVISPERMAVLIRVLLSGLVVEMAGTTTEREQQELDQAYRDIRTLFGEFVVMSNEWDVDEHTDSVPLPW